MSALAATGIMCATGFLVFNIKFRTQKYKTDCDIACAFLNDIAFTVVLIVAY